MQVQSALKERIVSESLKLFTLKGYLSTSINDVLQAAGASKGGLYNHFRSKEELFAAVLSKARKIWRERNLHGLAHIQSPVGRLLKLLENYRDRYLKDHENFPGGCIFVNLAVELADERPHLARELNEGFRRLKAMFKRLLEEAKERGEVRGDLSTDQATELLFSGMLGASLVYGVDKSEENLNRTINALMDFLRGLGGAQFEHRTPKKG
jgi:TetR/AcrR family transcriptional repressor of nem operon